MKGWAVAVTLVGGTLVYGVDLSAQADDLIDVAYGPEFQQRLDFCPTTSPAPSPMVIMIHGGGWSGGKKEDFRPLCRRFAANGIAAATVGYRLADGTSGGAWPAQTRDVVLAVAWLKENAARFNIDTHRICVYGHSAGGHIALMLGKSSLPTDSGVFRPACIVDNWGPVDFNYSPAIRAAIRALFPSSTDDRLIEDARVASPLEIIDSSFPPVFVAQGTKDNAVPPAQSQSLVEKLRANKVEYEFLEFSGGHEMIGLTPAEKKAIIDLEIAFVLRSSGTTSDGRLPR